MKALFIGGTGTISTSITELCVKRGWNVTLLNRGNRPVPQGVRVIQGDIHDEAAVSELLKDEQFDVAADFIAYTTADVERDIRLLEGKIGQYLFISSASAYQKPLSSPWINESTPLHNPYWEYSRNKIACEQRLMQEYNEKGFPVTIVRPSHTYCERSVPVLLHGANGSFAVLERIRQGKPVIVPGDGLTLWTLTHSRDFAVAFVGLMSNIHALGQAYQITGDESLTWNQIYEAIGSALGVKPKMVHISAETIVALCPGVRGNLLGDKSNNVLFDNRKIKQIVPEFCATIRFDQGVREAVEYIYSHPECQRPDPAFDQWCDRLAAEYEKMVEALPAFQM